MGGGSEMWRRRSLSEKRLRQRYRMAPGSELENGAASVLLANKLNPDYAQNDDMSGPQRSLADFQQWTNGFIETDTAKQNFTGWSLVSPSERRSCRELRRQGVRDIGALLKSTRRHKSINAVPKIGPDDKSAEKVGLPDLSTKEIRMERRHWRAGVQGALSAASALNPKSPFGDVTDLEAFSLRIPTQEGNEIITVY